MTESLNLNENIKVKDVNGDEVLVVTATAVLNTENMSVNIGVYIQNKQLATENATEVAQRYNTFYAAVKSRATGLGFFILNDGDTN